MFERAKKEAARMSAGDWNVGSIVSARGRRRPSRQARPPALVPTSMQAAAHAASRTLRSYWEDVT